MHSLNIPVPGWVARLAFDLFPYLAPLDRVRDRHTLVCKRFEDADLDCLCEQLRRALAGQPAFEARVADVRFFEELPYGAASVVYLVVNSPGLLDFHRTLTDDFGVIEGVEGDDHIPHVTLARGGSVVDARVVASQPLDPIEWIVLWLDIYDSSFRETVASISSPA